MIGLRIERGLFACSFWAGFNGSLFTSGLVEMRSHFWPRTLREFVRAGEQKCVFTCEIMPTIYILVCTIGGLILSVNDI